MTTSGCGVLVTYIAIIFSLSNTADASTAAHKLLGFNNHGDNNNTENSGKRWAILVAGSKGYSNYRHQADVCHAYQVLKRGGLEDKNIIVFMYDDIANNPENPRPGVIINRPNGTDVTTEKFYAAILGNRSALNGGSGKVLETGPNDHVFLYYSDHGSTGVLGMPAGGYVHAKDLIDVLQKKHDSKGNKSMVIYVEACESGSIFEGLLSDKLDIYATTESNAAESSYGTYCPGEEDVPSQYSTCLGDLYSISWMEDCDEKDLRNETLGKQYQIVMQYGNVSYRHEHLSTYMGDTPKIQDGDASPSNSPVDIRQRDADLLYFQHKFQRAPDGSRQKLEARKLLLDEIAHRKQEDCKITKLGELLFGKHNSSQILMNVNTYEIFCGHLSTYGMKYTRAIANICNAGVTEEKMVAALSQTCSA